MKIKVIVVLISISAFCTSLVQADGRWGMMGPRHHGPHHHGPGHHWFRIQEGGMPVRPMCRLKANPQERMQCMQQRMQERQKHHACIREAMNKCMGTQLQEVGPIVPQVQPGMPAPSAPPLEEEVDVIELEEISPEQKKLEEEILL